MTGAPAIAGAFVVERALIEEESRTPSAASSTAGRLAAEVESGTPTARRDPWLGLIAALKVAKGTFLLGAAVAALGLMSPRTARPLSRWAMEVAADRHYEIAEAAVAHLLSVDPRTLRLVSAGSFLYAILFYTEGFGLFWDQRWAKYMTLLTTGALIPLELYEVARRPTGFKVAVLVANAAIVAYLARRVRAEVAAERVA